jgi:hypothetical protein
MSALTMLRNTADKLHAVHEDARKRWRENSDEDGAKLVDEVAGTQIVMKYEGSNRDTDYHGVFLDGHLFARERETIPWNIFKPISVGYTVFLDLSLESAQDFVKQIEPVGKIELDEEWYPPLDRAPMYYAHCTEFDDVLALWKLWKSKYLKDHE